jgi:hypothetical protein
MRQEPVKRRLSCVQVQQQTSATENCKSAGQQVVDSLIRESKDVDV